MKNVIHLAHEERINTPRDRRGKSILKQTDKERMNTEINKEAYLLHDRTRKW